MTWPIGTVSHGRPGQRSRQRLRDTWPWRRETPFTRAESRMARDGHVELPGDRRDACRAGRAASRSIPISSQIGPAQASSCSTEKASCPAGTGVWVVKTLCARTWRTASSKGVPAASMLAQPLDHHERRVALVGVPHRRARCRGPAAPARRPRRGSTPAAPGGRGRRRRACSSARGRRDGSTSRLVSSR